MKKYVERGDVFRTNRIEIEEDYDSNRRINIKKTMSV